MDFDLVKQDSPNNILDSFDSTLSGIHKIKSKEYEIMRI